jgi:pimeloyl-ACP methyl ester carboxylesterase
MGAFPDKEYPARLTGTDSVAVEVFARLNELRKERDAYAPEEFCRKFWSVLRLLYVVDPADAPRADWGRCELPNERNFMRYWTEALLPSIQALRLAPEDWARIETPVLTIHGTKDRSVPYGAGRDWALTLPNARLLTVADAGHLPWIEAPDTVLDAIRTFLDGAWPDAAVKVDRLDPEPTP